MNNSENLTSNKLLRKRSREQLKGNWTSAVLVCFIYWLILSVISGVSGVSRMISDASNGLSNVSAPENTSLSIVVLVIQLIVGGPLTFGLCKFFLNLVRGNCPKIEDLFKGFKTFGTTFLINLIVGIFQFLWALLFVIPVVILMVIYTIRQPYAYEFSSIPLAIMVVIMITVAVIVNIIVLRYAMAYYVFNDNSDMGVMEAIKESVSLMKENKIKLFLLYLSFIGWSLLGILTLGIGYLWLVPYIKTSVANFYEDLIGNKPRNEVKKANVINEIKEFKEINETNEVNEMNN